MANGSIFHGKWTGWKKHFGPVIYGAPRQIRYTTSIGTRLSAHEYARLADLAAQQIICVGTLPPRLMTVSEWARLRLVQAVTHESPIDRALQAKADALTTILLLALPDPARVHGQPVTHAARQRFEDAATMITFQRYRGYKASTVESRKERDRLKLEREPMRPATSRRPAILTKALTVRLTPTEYDQCVSDAGTLSVSEWARNRLMTDHQEPTAREIALMEQLCKLEDMLTHGFGQGMALAGHEADRRKADQARARLTTAPTTPPVMESSTWDRNPFHRRPVESGT